MSETHIYSNGAKFWEKLESDTHGKGPMTISKPGKVLSKVDSKVTAYKGEQKSYISGVGKMLHMTGWIRPDILNSVCECSMMMIVQWNQILNQ